MKRLEDEYGEKMANEIRVAQPLHVQSVMLNELVEAFGACGVKLRNTELTLLQKDIQVFVESTFDKYLGLTFPELFSKD